MDCTCSKNNIGETKEGVWYDARDKSLILPSMSSTILVTNGKTYSLVSVERFIETVDKPFNEWTHWMEIPKVNTEN